MFEEKRMHRIFGTIDAAHICWDHFVNHHATSWQQVEANLTRDLTEILSVSTNFNVKIASRLEANECYLDGSTYAPKNSKTPKIDIGFYCSQPIYRREVAITLPVLAELSHEFAKVILHEYSCADQADINTAGDPLYDFVDPLEVDAYSTELAYDYVRRGNLDDSDVFVRFQKVNSVEVKSELYHLTALKVEVLQKMMTVASNVVTTVPTVATVR